MGVNQAPRQAAANTGADEGGAVRLVDDGFTYPAVADIVSVTVTSRGGLYIGIADGGDTSDGQTGLDIAITPRYPILDQCVDKLFSERPVDCADRG